MASGSGLTTAPKHQDSHVYQTETHKNSTDYGVQEKICGEASLTFHAISHSGDEECYPEEPAGGTLHVTPPRSRPGPAEPFGRDSGKEASSAGPSDLPIPTSFGARAAMFRDYAMNVDGAANSPEHALRDPERGVYELVSRSPSRHNKTEDLPNDVYNRRTISLPSYALTC